MNPALPSALLQLWLVVQVALGVAWGLERALPARPPGEQQRRARLLIALAVGGPTVVGLAAWAPGAGLGDGLAAVWSQWFDRGGALAPFVPAQVWGGLGASAAGLVGLAARVGAVTGSEGVSAGWGAVAVGFVAFTGLGWLGLNVGRLAYALRRAVIVREVGVVRVVVGAGVGVPFAVRTPGRALVVLDPETYATPGQRDIAIRHELGHHRRGDPTWALSVSLLRALSWPNPAAHLWSRRLALLDEQACDAAVAPRVGAVSYAEVLVAVAARVVSPPAFGAGLVPSLLLSRGAAGRSSPLSQRITMLLAPPRTASPLRARAALAVSTLLLLALAPFASGPAVARAPGADALAPSSLDAPHLVGAFPLETAAPVQAALAQMRDNPRRAEWMRLSIAARPGWSALVDGALREAGLPAELAAVPLVESGYTNWGAPGERSHGSLAPGIPGRGLWMFIPATARVYGLRVDETVDERLDPVRETEAAVALLADLYDTYGDWRLALAGYNQGEAAVNRAITAQGTRDVWALVEAGALNGYVAEVVAAALVLRDPALIGG